ncbi:MAG: TIGR01906 family membrane protein [Clostridiales Family XIII bacterium]|jgi:integral membrane protein (TIGR01906 family)|nr:TIGR01906 family membrane protein [Clostridiales Family XIII bacterium]
MAGIKEKRFTVSNVAAALLLTLFLFSFAVTFTLNFRPLYYFNIAWLDIPSASGLSPEEIKANYDALISYNSIFARGALEFPTLPMSESGRVHFAEVKDIFVAIQALMVVSLAAGAAACALKLRKKRTAFLRIGAVCPLVLTIAIGALIATNWTSFFVAFHKVFFDNDLWIFDSRTDPVIELLPDAFFLECALMILLLIVVGSVIFGVIGYRLGRRFKKENPPLAASRTDRP